LPSPFVFAFLGGFANLPLLGGLAAASIPIILHLLNRRRFREERWAAMRFLLAAIRRNQRRIRVEQWLLLAVRTLLLILLVLAMAKPFLDNGALPILAGQRTHRVIVLDGSLSMGHVTTDATRFDQAKELAAKLIKTARKGDAVSILLMADPPKVVVKEPSANHAEVLKELADVTLPHGGTDLAATLSALDRVLDSSDISQKDVVFISDLQTASWRVRRGGEEALKRAIAKLESRKPSLGTAVIDLGAAGDTNRAVVDLKIGSPIVTPAMVPTPSITVTVREFGREAPEGARVQLLIDGQVGPEKIVYPRRGEDATATFLHDFGAPGDHVVEAVIGDDPLKLDNHRWLAIPVRESLRALLVDGDPKADQPFHGETDFLAVALNPEVDSSSTPSTIRSEVIPESRFASTDLTPYDVVVLCNVAQVTDREVSSLESFLKQGGGVVVFGGNQVMADNYNRLLFAGGKGILPAEILQTVGGPETNATPFQFKPLGFRHAIVREFAGQPESVAASLTGVNTTTFHKLRLPPNSNAETALAFENDDPAVIEAPRHRGTVIQVATTADRDWTTWPLHKSYPPIMEKVVFQAASGRMNERNVRVGQAFDQALPPAAGAAAATVRRPDGRDRVVKLQTGADVSRFFFEGTDLSGLYQVKIGPPLRTETSFAANPDPIESDPAKLDRAGLMEATPGWSFDYFNNTKNLLHDATAVTRRGELQRPFLWAVLALLIVESILAWWFGHHR
jgi:Aerotolerance regulator N-terminal/von Willebrand factor type A domain